MSPPNVSHWLSVIIYFKMPTGSPNLEAPPGLIWQLADSAFPGGGFAHSSGLESAWQHGEIRNAIELAGYLDVSLRQASYSSVPFLTAVYDDLDSLPDVDRLTDIWLINPAANRASRLQGRALHSSALRIFQITVGKTPFRHLAPVLGSVLKSMSISRLDSVRLLLFVHLRGLLSAAVRLSIIGPLEAQSIQFDRLRLLENLVVVSGGFTLDDVSQMAPLQDIWQANHDLLTSRLFQS